MAVAASVFNSWVVSGFDWSEVAKVPTVSFIFTTFLPMGWFGLFGIGAAIVRIVREVDWPKNRAELETMRQRPARELRLDPADIRRQPQAGSWCQPAAEAA